MPEAALRKVDGGVPHRLSEAADASGALEERGHDGGWTAETNHTAALKEFDQ